MCVSSAVLAPGQLAPFRVDDRAVQGQHWYLVRRAGQRPACCLLHSGLVEHGFLCGKGRTCLRCAPHAVDLPPNEAN